MKYRDAGVDIDAGDEFVRRIKARVRETFGPGVVTDLGSFGGVMEVPGLPDTLMIASIDGVGTKLLLAADTGRLENVGADIVHHCINDISVHGARAAFFLDYIGTGRLEPEKAAVIVESMAVACREQGVALLGGETAEMPGLYRPGHYDLVGAIVGFVKRSGFIDGADIRAGDVLVGLASDGLHTNGYSLARRVLFEQAAMEPDESPADLGTTLVEALLAPHRCYAGPIQSLAGAGLLKGAAHITGGGLPGNLARILPDSVDAAVEAKRWSIPPIFRIIADAGPVESGEMFRTFNMGIGLVAVIPDGSEGRALDALRDGGENAFVIGRVTPGSGRVTIDDGVE